MDYSSKPTSITTILNGMKKGKYNLGHPLQRKAGQWNKEQQTLLIASLLQGYPINPIYTIKEKGKIAILDGLQRLTTIQAFKNNDFALQRNIKAIDIDGVRVEIKNKKFDDLPEDLQEKITETELQVYEIRDYTEENIRELFYRQNNGTPLSKCQKATTMMEYDKLQKIDELSKMSFWSRTKLTPTARKKDEEREVVIEALALMHDGSRIRAFYKSYLYNDYAQRLQKDKDFDKYCEEIKRYLSDLKVHMPEDNNNVMKKVTIPYVIYGAYKVHGLLGEDYITSYAVWLKDFFDNYETNEDYKQYCQAGSSSKTNVLGRKKYFDDELEKFCK